MTGVERASLEKRAKVISSLAHPSRLVIVEALESGEQTVSDLTTVVGSDISTVSRHLGVLRQAGIVSSRKEGNRVLYRLVTPCLTRFFQCVEQVIADTCRECE
jgi:ArsR family transcriptional regulator